MIRVDNSDTQMKRATHLVNTRYFDVFDKTNSHFKIHTEASVKQHVLAYTMYRHLFRDINRSVHEVVSLDILRCYDILLPNEALSVNSTLLNAIQGIKKKATRQINTVVDKKLYAKLNRLMHLRVDLHVTTNTHVPVKQILKLNHISE